MKYKYAEIAYETFFKSIMISNGYVGKDAPEIPPFEFLQDDLKKAWFDATEAIVEQNNIQDDSISDEEYEHLKQKNGFSDTIGSVEVDKQFLKTLDSLEKQCHGR